MNTYERKKRQAELEQINKKQRPGKSRESVQLDLSQIKTFEYLLQDPETPWVEEFIALVKAGQRQESYQADRFNTAVEGMVIPNDVIRRLSSVLGRPDLKLVDNDRSFKKKKPFNLATITEQLSCTPEQAATLLAFTILLEDKYYIVLALKNPEIQAKFGVNFDEAKVKAFFKSEEFLNAATNKTLERSLPLLAKEAGIKGIQHIIRYLRVFDFKPNLEHLRRAFGTSQRQAEFRTLLSGDLKEALDVLPDYEYLFGELSREEFLALFPTWDTTESFRTYTYERRYTLERPRPEPIPSTPSAPETAARTTRPEPVAPVATPQAVITPQTPDVVPLPKPDDLKKLFRWGAVALGLASVGTVGGGAVVWEVANRYTTTEPATGEGDDEQAYVTKESLAQRVQIESNNFSPEATEFEHGDNFVAVPELHRMRVTAVYTTQEPHGVLTYQPELAFSIDPEQLTEKNSREHIIAERFFAQAAVLYPPELGSIDPASIEVPGRDPKDYIVTEGEQGRFQVSLNEASNKPLEVVYSVRVAHPGVSLDHTGELPPVPKSEQADNIDRAGELNLQRRAGESDLAFALRAENTLQGMYRYPETGRENSLSYDQAREEFIGDCDVVNQELLGVLHSQGIRSELVVDTHPVPGRENHGQVRALVYSDIAYGYVVKQLDATPHLRTPEGTATQEKITLQPPAPEEESETKKDLKKLIEEYKKSQEAEEQTKGAESTPTDTASKSERPRTIEAREWRALGGGVYGYADYVLKHSFSLPTDKAAREKVTGELAEIMLKELQRSKVIPEGVNPYEWARDIDPEEAEALLKAMDSSPLISSLVRELPKYERRKQ